MAHRMRLSSDVGAKMSMFDQRAKEHKEGQMINPFSDWSGAGIRCKLSREDPNYGRPVEGSKTAERGRLAVMQMMGDMVELCDVIHDCGTRSSDGRATISFGTAFRLYNSINDKVVGLLMRGRKHKILNFEGEMLFQGRDDRTMIELLLPLNTIRHKYGKPERAGCGDVRPDLVEALTDQQPQQQRTRSAAVPQLPLPAPLLHKSRSVDGSWAGDTEGCQEREGRCLLDRPAAARERSRRAVHEVGGRQLMASTNGHGAAEKATASAAAGDGLEQLSPVPAGDGFAPAATVLLPASTDGEVGSLKKNTNALLAVDGIDERGPSCAW